MASKTPDTEPEKLALPSLNPLPLSASQEAQVRDVYYKRVRRLCADEIKAFAECAVGRSFTVAWACKEQHRAMNSCMASHATRAEHDAARQEWFSMRQERQRKREAKAKVAAAQEEFMREWWGLPEEVRLSKKREMEDRGERIGGMPAANRPRIDEKTR
ncbi:cytochrome c oxidase biogenesis protein Cmc1 like-domain-containing protein [Stachybotrys elegans]|uniref:COX assembly mitochondrial protein n=1 Tax=Stachybotrys elegans TaxID=80388 RepID=A0A8K0SNI6_9HYPO|nr:cytochrome c oxidase biogenesis protein Cmc1 like-domain-containing protein [Stachybotrys elegans]